MVCFQTGAALAKQLFPLVGAQGAVALRLGIAALILLAVFRPWRMRPSAPQALTAVIYGLAMGWMNFFFYLSLEHIPLGLAVALEFTGPLAVAMAASRRPLDFLWIALAALGVIAILPLRHQAAPLAPVGIAFALAAAGCWALYIVFGQRAGNLHAGQMTAVGTLVGAWGVAHAGWALFAPALLPVACTVALLSSALPYSLEMYAMTRVPTRTFGVLMSLDPALGALSGLWFLRETLSVVQWAAIVSIMLATAGSAATSRRDAAPPLGSPPPD